MTVASGDTLLAMLLDLFARLRTAGVPVSLVEKVDAAAALGVLPLDDRPVLRAALRSAMVKRVADHAVFDRLFDRSFPLTTGSLIADAGPSGATNPPLPPQAPDDIDLSPGGGEITSSAPPTGGGGQTADQALLAELVDALQRGDADALRQLAGRFVDAYAGLDGHASSERSHYYRVLRAADLSNLLSTVMRHIRTESPEAMADALVAKMELAEQARQIDQFRRMIAEQIRTHLDDLLVDQGQQPPNRRLEDLDIVTASVTDLRAMREAVRPLARKLASRLSQRRRFRHVGRLDMRRTLRHSLATGGVPIDVKYRAKRASKPDVVMLCDVSGSVADFAHFTLMLMQGLHSEMARLRTFVFVDGIADVTETLAGAVDDFDPRYLVYQPGAVVGDGHSDYGAVLSRFLSDHGSVITPATTVLVTGDARTNYRAAGLDDFAALAGRAKRVYWLNPEPRADWGDKDSEIAQFAPSCTAVFEVRTLTDLVNAVALVV